MRARVRDILDDPRAVPFVEFDQLGLQVEIQTEDGREYQIHIGREDPNAIVIRTTESRGLKMAADGPNAFVVKSIRRGEEAIR